MSATDKADRELDKQVQDQSPEAIKKRKERKKREEDKISTKPSTTQKGKKRTTDPEQTLKLFQERQQRVVNKLPRSRAEKNLLRASTKQLNKIAKGLGIEGLSNLRKPDLVILIIRAWNNCPKV